MSAVVSAAKSVVKAVTKPVTKVVEAVGKTVKKVADVVVDTVKYVAKNPEIIAIAIAAPYAVAAVGSAVGASATAISLATQPITAAAITASQGGDIEDIGKAALGSFIGQPVGQFAAAKTGAAIGTANAAQVALANAVGGAVGSAAGAAAMGEDIGKAAKLGAIGSAGASLARTGATNLGANQTGTVANIAADIGEAVGRGSITGNIGQELVGAGVNTIIGAGNRALDELASTGPTKTAATKPAPPPFGAQIGEKVAGTGEMSIAAPPSIAARPEFATRPGEVGDIVVKYTERDGTVTYRKDVTSTLPTGQKSGYTIVYDPQTDTVEYEFVSGGDVGSTGGVAITSSKTRPGETPPASGASKPSPDVRTGKATDIAKNITGGKKTTASKSTKGGGTPTKATSPSATGGATTPATGGATTQPTTPGGPVTGGQGAGGAGENLAANRIPPVEEMTGSELLGDAIAGGGGGDYVDGGGGGGGEGIGGGGGGDGDGGGGGEGLAEEPSDLESLTDEELLALLDEETPLIPPDDTGEGFRPLDVRLARGGKTGTQYQSSISSRAVGSSPTAAIIGAKEPIFGGDEGVQSEAWNTRSLRLRKALGL